MNEEEKIALAKSIMEDRCAIDKDGNIDKPVFDKLITEPWIVELAEKHFLLSQAKTSVLSTPIIESNKTIVEDEKVQQEANKPALNEESEVNATIGPDVPEELLDKNIEPKFELNSSSCSELKADKDGEERILEMTVDIPEEITDKDTTAENPDEHAEVVKVDEPAEDVKVDEPAEEVKEQVKTTKKKTSKK